MFALGNARSFSDSRRTELALRSEATYVRQNCDFMSLLLQKCAIIVVRVLSLDIVCFWNKNIHMAYRKLDLLPYCLKKQVIPEVKLGYNQYLLSGNATHCTITCDIPVSPLCKYVNT